MGELYNDFLTELADLEAKHAGDPIAEITALLLIAIEREQLVSIAYRDDLMAERVERMNVPEDARDLIRQSLKWAWKEEQMHTVYSRGLLFKLGGRGLKLRALKLQLEGAIGGWASSTKNHVPFWRAPLARMLAGVLTTFGNLTGKVPRAIRESLRYLSFRKYCAMQVDAELTAAEAWKRMYTLAVDLEDERIDADDVASFEKMWRDEERHRVVFEAIGDAMDESDRMWDGAFEPLLETIQTVGDFYMPLQLRQKTGSPVGAGGVVAVIHGESKNDVVEEACGAVGVAELVAQTCREKNVEPASINVAIKTTFMLGYHRGDRAVITDPEVVAGVVAALRSAGVERVVVGDGATLYDSYFERRSVEEVAHYFGFEGDYELVDFGDDQVPHDYGRGMGQSTISRRWRDADVRIFVSKLRTHPVDFAHISLGAAQGLGERFEKYLFLERQADRETALFMPITDFPPDVTIVDAFDSAADGVIGMISCVDAPSPRRIYASRDPLALDRVAARHMGLVDERDSRFLTLADHWFGDPDATVTVTGVDQDLESFRSPIANPWRALLSALAFPVWQLFGGRGAMFLPPMDEEAFPPTVRHGILFRMTRGIVRFVIGMKTP